MGDLVNYYSCGYSFIVYCNGPSICVQCLTLTVLVCDLRQVNRSFFDSDGFGV